MKMPKEKFIKPQYPKRKSYIYLIIIEYFYI